MMKRIIDTSRTLGRIRDTGKHLPRIDAAAVAKALGGEPTGEKIDVSLGPISLFAVRQEVFRRLQSTGGRPALEGATRRTKIPLSDCEWAKLEELAAAVASPSFAPTAGQVASILLTLSLRSIAAQGGHAPTTGLVSENLPTVDSPANK
jgi:hypothetical protein